MGSLSKSQPRPSPKKLPSKEDQEARLANDNSDEIKKLTLPKIPARGQFGPRRAAIILRAHNFIGAAQRGGGPIATGFLQ